MKIKNIIGWVLLVVGLVIVFWVLYSSYNIFTAKVQAPEIFKVPKKEAILPSKEKTPALEAQMEEKMQEIIGEQLKGLISVDLIPKLLNLMAWSIFAGILIFGGAQISSLGIKLLKT